MAEWIKKKKHDPMIRCLQDNHFSFKDTHGLRMKGWKKINLRKEKEAVVATLISYKIVFKLKLLKKDKKVTI